MTRKEIMDKIALMECDGTFNKMASKYGAYWSNKEDKIQDAILYVIKNISKFDIKNYTVEQNIGQWFIWGIKEANRKDSKLNYRQRLLKREELLGETTIDIKEDKDFVYKLIQGMDIHRNAKKFLYAVIETPNLVGVLKQKYSLGRGKVPTFEEVIQKLEGALYGKED